MLVMPVPVDRGDRIRMQHPVRPTLVLQLRRAGQQAITLDPAIHYYMTHMDVLRPIFTGDALRQMAQRPFGRRKRREFGLAAQARGSTREKQRAATMPDQHGNGRLRQLETSQRVFAPTSSEAFFGHFNEWCPLVAASVVNRHGKRCKRFSLGNKALDVLSTRAVA